MHTEQQKTNDTLIRQLQHLPLEEVPADLSECIMQRLKKKQPGIFKRFYRFIHSPATFSFRPAYAFSLLLLLIGAFSLGRISQQPVVADHASPHSRLNTLAVTDNAQAAYLLGRGLLAADRGSEALNFFQQAAHIEPENPEYAYWEGLGYWASGDSEMERKSYRRGLAAAPESVPLLVNLGHSYLSEKSYDEALAAYQAALSLAPGEPSAQYNSGLIYRRLKKVDKEIQSWKAYLQDTRTGRQALRAVERLNGYGDFSHRIYRIGARRLILSPDILLNSSLPEEQRRAEISPLAALLENNTNLRLEIVVFKQDDSATARSRAEDIKRMIVSETSTEVSKRVVLSWFDKPETVQLKGVVKKELVSGLLLFSYNSTTKNSEVSI